MPEARKSGEPWSEMRDDKVNPPNHPGAADTTQNNGIGNADSGADQKVQSGLSILERYKREKAEELVAAEAKAAANLAAIQQRADKAKAEEERKRKEWGCPFCISMVLTGGPPALQFQPSELHPEGTTCHFEPHFHANGGTVLRNPKDFRKNRYFRNDKELMVLSPFWNKNGCRRGIVEVEWLRHELMDIVRKVDLANVNQWAESTEINEHGLDCQAIMAVDHQALALEEHETMDGVLGLYGYKVVYDPVAAPKEEVKKVPIVQESMENKLKRARESLPIPDIRGGYKGRNWKPPHERFQKKGKGPA